MPEPASHAADGPEAFRLAFAPGVTPGKWVRVWTKRLPDAPIELLPCSPADALAAVRSQDADAGLVRLPIDRDGLHAIPLYTETTVVVMPKDHVLTLADAVEPDDLADEIVHHPLDDVLEWTATSGPPGTAAIERPGTTRDAVDLVLAGVGLVVLPQSLARLHHRKELVYRPLEAPEESGLPPIPHSPVALVWREDRTTDLMEEFIGIVRGRTPNSSRGSARAAATSSPGSASGKPAGSAGTPQRSGAQNKRGPQKNRKPGPRGRPGRGRPGHGRRR